MTSLYIYYRVRLEHIATLAPAVLAMQLGLRSAMPGLAARLCKRVDAISINPTDPQTWMEIYHFNGHADERAWGRFDEALALGVSSLPDLIDGERHTERFAVLAAATAF